MPSSSRVTGHEDSSKPTPSKWGYITGVNRTWGSPPLFRCQYALEFGQPPTIEELKGSASTAVDAIALALRQFDHLVGAYRTAGAGLTGISFPRECVFKLRRSEPG